LGQEGNSDKGKKKKGTKKCNLDGGGGRGLTLLTPRGPGGTGGEKKPLRNYTKRKCTGGPTKTP